MSKQKQAYPLSWPLEWPRTAPDDRKYGRFSKKRTNERGWTSTEDITINEALKRINNELEVMDGPQRGWKRIDPDQTIISTNLKVRRGDGLPVSSQKEPEDPGAVLYFQLDGKPRYVPCDSYTKVAQNLAGIAATLCALRALERHGSGLMERAFTGFTAVEHQPNSAWYTVLGVPQDATERQVKAAWKKRRSETHPDKPDGSNAAFHQVQQAYREYQSICRDV